MDKQVFDVVILGGGPSGLTAAIYTGRAKLSTMVLAGNPAGGQLMGTSEVENFPGFPAGVKGPELIGDMRKQAVKFGALIRDENVSQIAGSFQEKFSLVTDAGNSYQAKTIIVSTGASAKWLGVPGEQELKCRGVSACAVCDGFFFTNKVVAVVGAGDVALEEAIFLTKYARKVIVLVRGEKSAMKASQIMQDKAFAHKNIEFRFNVQVTKVLGTEHVTGLELRDSVTGSASTLSSVDGLFVAIGHSPNTAFLSELDRPLVELGKHGYAIPKSGTQTHTQSQGVFVAGDVSDWRYRQAITAAGFGCMAAIDCEKFLAENS